MSTEEEKELLASNSDNEIDHEAQIISVERPDPLHYESWDIDMIITWIGSLDNGKYKQYCNVFRTGFESDGITSGESLPRITKSDLRVEPFKITNFNDRTALARHFASLAVKAPSVNIPAARNNNDDDINAVEIAADLDDGDDININIDADVQQNNEQQPAQQNANVNFHDGLLFHIFRVNSNDIVMNNNNDYVENFKLALKNPYNSNGCCDYWCFAHFVLILGIVAYSLMLLFLNLFLWSDDAYDYGEWLGSDSPIIAGILWNIIGCAMLIIHFLALYGIYHCNPALLLLFFSMYTCGIIFSLIFPMVSGLNIFTLIQMVVKFWFALSFWKIYRLSKFYKGSVRG